MGDRVHGLVHPENSNCENAIRGRGNLSTEIDMPGHTMFGGNAQYVSRPEHYWVHLPDNVSFEQAAAGSWSYPTSHRIIVDRCQVKIGDIVLITGLSGGMGNAALQWAKLAGARVIGTTRNHDKKADLLTMGADFVVVTEDIEQAQSDILKHTSGRGVNHFIEFTGNSELIALPKTVLALGGTVCQVGGDVYSDHIPYTVFDLTRKEMQIVGIRGSRRIDQITYLEQLSAGKITVPIACEMPLSEIQEAHRMVENSQVTGKILINPWG